MLAARLRTTLRVATRLPAPRPALARCLCSTPAQQSADANYVAGVAAAGSASSAAAASTAAASTAAASSAAPPNPAAAYAEHKFLVLRSKMGNLPVYYKVSNGGTNERTVLRKYGGDVNKLIAALQTVVDDAAIALGKHPRHLPVPIRLYHGRLEVKGRWTRTISDWLTGLGF